MNESITKPTSLTLVHFSKGPLNLKAFNKISSKKFNLQDTVYGKPIGLWLSDESDYGWRQWCESEDFNLKNLSHQTVFNVSLEKIILLQNSEDLLLFTEKYSDSRTLPTYFNLPKFKLQGIDWGAVGRDYNGIIITPYQWENRLKFSWYYPWDCASGCIWNLESLSEVRRFKTSEENVILLR